MMIAETYGSTTSVWESLVAVFWYGVFFMLPAALLSVLVHFLLSLPMRRRDRTLFFLDLLETALQRGQSVEHAILTGAETRDQVMGVRFFLVAAHIENGMKLGEALEREPRFLPPRIAAILRAGEKLGDLKSVLPACRENLRVRPDSIHTTLPYMVGLLMVFAPISIWLMSLLNVFVIPKFKEVAQGMNVSLYPVTQFVLAHTAQMILLEAALFSLLFVGAIVYVGGPGFVRWFQYRSVPVVDGIVWLIPWKRKGLQRTFSAMLAVLLDGGVPEPEAVRLAGESTANEICRRRSVMVTRALEQGVCLSEAVREFDDSGEFHWRLTNATYVHGGGFLRALRGWHEVLDARAWQEQEAAAQTLTSSLVILNGIIVGLIATGLFGILIAILKGALLAE